jgi:glycerophosphoryl diester phosphodiesterase
MTDGLDTSWLTAAPIAHRGLHDDNRQVAENSLLAFALAVERGWPIELDVRLLGDGTVAVVHDADLRRVAGVQRPLRALGAADLAEVALVGESGVIPTLPQVLDLVAGRVPLIVELKPQPRGSRLAAAVDAVLSGYRGEAAVLSFDPRLVAWFARRRPGRLRGLNAGAGVPLAGGLLDGDTSLRFARPHFVGFAVERLPAPLTVRIRARGRPVLAYTVRSGAQQRIAEAHADGMFVEVWRTDDPVDLPNAE